MKWPQVTLAKIAKGFISGGTPSTKVERYWIGDIPWITGADVTDKVVSVGRKWITREAIENSATHIVPKGAILLVTRTGVGKVAKAGADIAISQDLTGIVLKDGIDTDFVVAAIQHKIGSLQHIQQGAIIKGVLRKDIKKLVIPLPPPSEQRRIVEILDQADALRKKRTEANAKAARILPALFYKMFGDPATNPKGWPVRALRDVTIGKPQYGANARATAWSKGKPRYVRITDITDVGRLRKVGAITLDLDNWEPYRLVPGDLLFARSGNTVGKTYIYHPEDGLCAYAGYLIRFRANTEHVEPWYLFALTQTDYYRNWVESRKRVAGQPNINGKEYASLQIPSPPVPLQQRFTKILEKLIGLREKRFTSTENIDHLFNVLLYRAFTGDLTTQWREAHMKELLAEMEQQAKALETPVVEKRVPKVKSKRHAGRRAKKAEEKQP